MSWRRGSPPWREARRGLVWLFAAGAAGTLQGCQLDVPTHSVGNWRAQPSYFAAFAASPPSASTPMRLNSCEDPGVAEALRCSGHGRCVGWFDDAPGSSLPELSFCECDQDWAGPECAVQRRSQQTAFLLAIFAGPLGADQFYLGWWLLGALKLCTLGGLGLWWIFDVVRTGSSPVAVAGSFRVANDVPHWAFVLTVISFSIVLGFAVSVWSINHQRLKKARELLLLKAEGQVGFKSYATMPSVSGGEATGF